MKVISLFTGAGGLDLGLEAAGFDIALCIEKDPLASKTLERNRPTWLRAEPGDIHQWKPDQLLRLAGLRRREAAMVAAGPPCQPFSKAGYWAHGDTGRLKDPRASTLDAFLDMVACALPRLLLLENVKGIAYHGKDEAIAHISRCLTRINQQHRTRYDLQVLHLNAAEYGVPQVRERVFLIADRAGRNLDRPQPTHYTATQPNDARRSPYTTAWDAIGDLDNGSWPSELAPTGHWADLLPSIPEGRNYTWHTDRGGGLSLFGWRTRFWSFLLKLAKDRPSWTLSAEPGPGTGPFHWKNRRLSPRELCRLQTFPDDFEPFGTLRDVQRQIGNATPPLLAEVLGKQIAHQLFRGSTRSRLKFAVRRSSNVLVPEPVRPVPRKYRSLQGHHPAHPGPGRGPRGRHAAITRS